MIEAIGGVNMAVCNSFLSQLEVYDENVGLVARVNTQQHRSLLFPIVNFMGSTLILQLSTLLNNPELCHLADEETPTANSGNLELNGMQDDDEIENYNDISSKFWCTLIGSNCSVNNYFSVFLENCPTNSTEVQNSALTSHPDIDISNIPEAIDEPLPDESVSANNEPSATIMQREDMVLTSTVDPGRFVCHCGKECTR